VLGDHSVRYSVVGGDCPKLHGRPCTKMLNALSERQDSESDLWAVDLEEGP
jgi:hypothetical protein